MRRESVSFFLFAAKTKIWGRSWYRYRSPRITFSFREMWRDPRILDQGWKDNQLSTRNMLLITSCNVRKKKHKEEVRIDILQTPNCRCTEIPYMIKRRKLQVTAKNNAKESFLINVRMYPDIHYTARAFAYSWMFPSKGWSDICSRRFSSRSLQARRSWICHKGCSLPLASPA